MEISKILNFKTLTLTFLHILIILDIIAISIAMFFTLPLKAVYFIQFFDFIICIILMIEWAVRFHRAESKKEHLKNKDTWIDLIASIPFDELLPVVASNVSVLKYLRLLKLLRVFALFKRFFNGFERFIKKSNLDKIIGGMFFTIIIFTLLLYVYGSSYNLFDDFYFVIVTLTTVGYGDVVPHTFNEKLIAIILIIAGVFIFSTITAAISSFLTDRMISDEDIEAKLDDVIIELKEMRSENVGLKKEINELKQLLNKR